MKKISLKNYADIAADLVEAGYTSEKVADLIIRGQAAGGSKLFTSDRAFYALLSEMDRISGRK